MRVRIIFEDVAQEPDFQSHTTEITSDVNVENYTDAVTMVKPLLRSAFISHWGFDHPEHWTE